MSKANLERVLDQASATDRKIAEGAWFRYQSIVGQIAAKYGFSTRIGAAVFAALSPNSDYLGNIRDTKRLLQHHANGQSVENLRVSTYGLNKLKAWRIASGEDPLELIQARKTRNFFLNVADPTDPQPVTIDGHMFNVWAGHRLALNSADMKQYSKHYDEVAGLVRQLAAERNLIPNVAQGLIWYCWKRLHQIKINGQLTFWHDDMIVSGLGFHNAAVIKAA